MTFKENVKIMTDEELLKELLKELAVTTSLYKQDLIKKELRHRGYNLCSRVGSRRNYWVMNIREAAHIIYGSE